MRWLARATITTALREAFMQLYLTVCEVRVANLLWATSKFAFLRVYYYPDVLVSYEEAPEDAHFRNEPILIVEVISPSTEHIDRREKLLFYQQMPSLQEYVVVEQKKIAVEIHRRQPNGSWITYFFNHNDEEVEFQTVEMTMKLEEIYHRVKFSNQNS